LQSSATSAMGRVPSMETTLASVPTSRVPLELGAAAAHPLERHARRHVEEDGQVRLDRVAVHRLDEVVRYARALVGERRQHVAVEDDVLAAREPRFDLGRELVEPVGSEQQRHHPLVELAGVAVGGHRRAAPREHLLDERAHRAFARLVRVPHRAALRLQPLGDQLRLRGGAGSVEPLIDNEPSARRCVAHVRDSCCMRGLALLSVVGSMPRCTRTSRSRARMVISRAIAACARR